jgi:hypothetical protein
MQSMPYLGFMTGGRVPQGLGRGMVHGNGDDIPPKGVGQPLEGRGDEVRVHLGLGPGGGQGAGRG